MFAQSVISSLSIEYEGSHGRSLADRAERHVRDIGEVIRFAEFLKT